MRAEYEAAVAESQLDVSLFGTVSTPPHPPDKRREKNMTQAELAEKIGVSNKTISKWENGKCMPDYAVIQSLCEELGITVSELMDGEDASKDSLRTYDEEQMLAGVATAVRGMSRQ